MRQGRFAGLGDPGHRGDQPALRLLAWTTGAACLAVAALALVAFAGLAAPALVGTAAGGLVLIGTAALTAGRSLRGMQSADEGQGARAQGFVDHLEASAGTCFWETNGEGDLSYVSPALARGLGLQPEALVGRSFDSLLLVEDTGSPEERPTLGFHLTARFPFQDVVVRANADRARGWLLSGTPRFDPIGRFLGFRGVASELNEQRRSAADAARLARFDSLTGLPNRGRMDGLLEEALANAESRKQSCALLLIDLDRFKQVNDTLGHPAGDALLQQVAERLVHVIGGEGQAGRLGGDEFQVLLPGIGEEGRLAALAERVIGALSTPYLIHGHAAAIGASVGIAISRPGRTYAKALVKEADLALYAAKRAGRGTYRLYEPEMSADEAARKMLEADLRSAIAKGQMRLLYQPLVDARTDRLTGFEALVRWWHPTRGPLAPADFLPIAEASGQIGGLGDWVVRTACADAAGWPPHLRLSLNIATPQLGGGRIAASLTSALAAAALAPERLELELDESALLAGDPAALDTLLSLQSLGVGLCLNRFGEGAASLASFGTVRLDRIKLHPAFLRAAAPAKSRQRALAVALVRMARELGMAVTATFAETLDELELIRALGCDEVQGYLFGRPMPADEAAAMAADSKPVDAREAARMRPPRHSLIRNGQLIAKGEAWPVRLRNISAGGAMVESGRDLAGGSAVELDLSDGLRLAGTVRWGHDGRLGIQFDRAFDLSRLGRARRETTDLVLQPHYLREIADKPRITIRDVRGG